MRTIAAALILAAVPALAEDPKPETPFPVTAAAWCIVHTSAEPADDAEAKPGCDAGVGLALQRWGKLSWVAVLGQDTLGTELAWVPYRPVHGPIPAVAVGVVLPYDSTGVDGSEPQLAIGATLAFAGKRD